MGVEFMCKVLLGAFSLSLTHKRARMQGAIDRSVSIFQVNMFKLLVT